MSSIFKTGTFGFSTVLSTPCDFSSDELLPKLDHHAASWVDRNLFEASPSCAYSGRASKSTSSSTTNLVTDLTPYQDENYDQIFETYSKIWREASLKEFKKQKAASQNTQLNSDQLFSQKYQSFSPAANSNQYHVDSCPNKKTASYSLCSCSQQQNEEVNLSKQINTQQLLDQFKIKVNQINQMIQENREEGASAWAQKIIYAFKIYSMRVTNFSDKLKVNDPSFSKCALQNSKYAPCVNSSNISTRSSSSINSKFSSPVLAPVQQQQMGGFPSQLVFNSLSASSQNDFTPSSGSYQVTGKYQTRQHLLEGGTMRQPLFPLSTNQNGRLVNMAQHKGSFDSNENIQLTNQENSCINLQNHISTSKIIEYNQPINSSLNQTTKTNVCNNVEVTSNRTRDCGGAGSNSSRTKDDDHEFNLSFEEDFLFDLQKGGIDLDE